VNLYNITWRGPDGRCRYDVLPRELTGVEANIVVLYGRDFPTGSHKVGAAYAVLLERELAGELDPGVHVCVWPSTGNYGIGGTWVAARMGFRSIVVLPKNVSAERFELLRRYGAEIVATPGSESNVHEVHHACAELQARDLGRICELDQFQALANYRFHYYVTGNTIVELASELASQGVGRGRVAAFVSAMGSGGTIAAGDRIKQVWPEARVVGLEPIQCPTLSNGGYGSHDIQGIGDKQATWIHNVMNMDAIAAIDDLECKQGLQLLTEEAGWRTMTRRYGVPEEGVQRMATYLGISGVCNVLGALKVAKLYGLGPNDLIVTVCTDAIDRYRSVMAQMTERFGPMDEVEAAVRLVSIFHKQKIDWIKEGTVDARKAWHHLKYYIWVEQRGKSQAELDAQQSQEYWLAEQAKIVEVDRQLLAHRAGGAGH
jgi:cysteine synthase